MRLKIIIFKKTSKRILKRRETMAKSALVLLIVALWSQTALASVKVLTMKIDGAIGPAAFEYVAKGIERGEKNDAAAILIELDTPGGLLESTRKIVSEILSSKIPIIVFVYPSGARAASAGAFITLAANVAVMAPGTNVGAAHPVNLGGGSDASSTMSEKIENDAAAFMRSIAQKRRRNVELAEKIVRKSVSLTAKEALDSGLIDFIAASPKEALEKIDGFDTETAEGWTRLETADAEIVVYEMDWRTAFLKTISDPNVAYILMLIGIYGVFFELYNPGSIFPGAIGAVSLILAAYSLQALPVNYAGAALIFTSLIMFILEIKITSYGLLTIGGIVSFFLGSIMLFKDGYNVLRVSMELIIIATLLTAAFFVILLALGLKAQSKKKETGKEGLIGEKGKTVAKIEPPKKGKVKVHGEIWSATADSAIDEGEEVIVKEVEGLTVKVEKTS